jgi:GMP synthase (glutamine-hydrolysing)
LEILLLKFLRVESKKLESINWLAQGTIYPDVIESAGNSKTKAKVIKSHHNVGGLPERMNLKLLEPFRMLFKDEVRKIGKTIGLPHEIVQRHPFPGPGLGIRIIGEVNHDRLERLREADHIFYQNLRNKIYTILPAKHMLFICQSSLLV